MPNRAERNSSRGGRKSGTRKSGSVSHGTAGRGVNVTGYPKPQYSSGLGGVLQNAFGTVLDSVGEVSNAAQALANPQVAEKPTTIRARPKPKLGPSPSGRSAADSGAAPDYLDQLMQSMLTDSASQTFDYESALKQSEQGIRGAYAAEINAIRSNNKAARKETKKARNQIEHMYNGLAASYGRDASVANQAGAADASAMTQLANQANQTISDTQAKTTGDQAKMLKDLGLEATADQIIVPDFKESVKTQAENTQTGLNRATTAKENGAANSRYFTRSAGGAKFEGKGRSADMLGELQKYVRANRGEIAGLKGKRATELAGNRTAVASATADAQAKHDADLWDMVTQAAQLKSDREDTNFDNTLAANKFKYQQSNDAANRALKTKEFQATLDSKNSGTSASLLPKNIERAMGLIQANGQQKKRLTSLLQGLYNTDAFKDGQIDTQLKNGKSKTTKLTPFAAAALAEKAARQANLSEVDIRTLRLAAMASAD